MLFAGCQGALLICYYIWLFGVKAGAAGYHDLVVLGKPVGCGAGGWFGVNGFEPPGTKVFADGLKPVLLDDVLF